MKLKKNEQSFVRLKLTLAPRDFLKMKKKTNKNILYYMKIKSMNYKLMKEMFDLHSYLCKNFTLNRIKASERNSQNFLMKITCICLFNFFFQHIPIRKGRN